MPLEIKAGDFAVLRDGDVVGPIEAYSGSKWCWNAGEHCYRDGGQWSAGNMPHDLDIVATFANRAEALAHVADNPMNRELYEDGPDLASVPQTVPSVDWKARIQDARRAGLLEAAEIYKNGEDWDYFGAAYDAIIAAANKPRPDILILGADAAAERFEKGETNDNS